uniref:Galectin n=1 Tax=Panagrellus redivivus TaxID=6233 RepID=A0A7E4VPN6_PANRE
MAEILRKVFGLHRKKVTQKNSITGRNNSFPVPYLSKLEGNALLPGQSLIVRGIIVGKEEFVINLTGGPRVELDADTPVLDDRLICIRVDIARKKAFLNACINGEWGREGSVKAKWAPGDEFDIRIRCLEDEYEIFIEHKLVAKFAHYVPLSQVSHIYVNGDVELFSVSWEGKFYSVPYAADVPGNFYPGRKLYVSAMAKKKAKHFFIDFHAGQDIALRVNPRFPAKNIVANTRSGQTWGTEQRLQNDEFPFKRKRNFDLLIYCEENRFIMYVNDCLVGTFEHRMSPRAIDKLTIEGDLVLQGVHLK